MVSTTKRVFNFSPGPCVLPTEILEQAAKDLVSWQGTGVSVMEMSHRSKTFVNISEQAKKDFAELTGMPKGYKIFFLQGGATFVFSALPMNLARGKKTANYLTTGSWSKQAKAEASKYIKTNEVFPAAKNVFQRFPEESEWNIDPEAAYFHFCHNETIHGVEATDDFPWHLIPKGMPVVCDMSSNICSRPIDWQHYDVIYAGAQKNMGPSGLAVLIVKEELIGHATPETPILMDFKTYAKASGTFHNTPNNWAIYMCGLNYSFMLKEGLESITRRNQEKAKILYDFIDNSNGYYISPVTKKYRSKMNIPFRVCNDKNLEAKFLKEATAAELKELGGHRSVGGMRASLYNAMPTEGVQALVAFMKKFQAENPQSAKL